MSDSNALPPHPNIFIYKGVKPRWKDRPKTITNIIVDSSVRKIDSMTFSVCQNVVEINCEEGLTEISDNGFVGLCSLQRIHLPHSLSVIGKSTFYKCRNLMEIIIPQGVTKIPIQAFYGCSALQKVTLPENLLVLDKYAFHDCTSLNEIIIPKGVRIILQHTFAGCTSLKKIVIHNPEPIFQSQSLTTCFNLQDVEFNQRQSYHFNIPREDITLLNNHEPPRYNFMGATQRGWGPEMWGLSLDQIEKVLQHPFVDENTTMRKVVNIAIKPATKSCGIGYALLMNHEKPLRAKVMVSHAWDETIGDFYRCLKRSGHKGPFWVCAFSIYQSYGDHDHPTIAEQLGDDPVYGPFATVLKDVDVMVAIVTVSCDIYTRLWCVYEMFVAQQLNKKVQLCPFISKRDECLGNLETDLCISRLSAPIQSKEAYCWDKNDMESIHKAILSSDFGFQGINESVEMIRLKYLMNYPLQNIKGVAGLYIDNLDGDNEQLLVMKNMIIHRVKAIQELASQITCLCSRIFPSKQGFVVKDMISFDCFSTNLAPILHDNTPVIAFRFWVCYVLHYLKEGGTPVTSHNVVLECNVRFEQKCKVLNTIWRFLNDFDFQHLEEVDLFLDDLVNKIS